MRILHIIPSLRKGGAERICLDICAELNKQSGVKVKLVYLNNLVEYEISGAKYDIEYIPSSVQLSLTKPAKYNIAGLEKLIQEFKPDIIHTHLFEAEIVSRSITYPQAKWFTHCHDNMRQFSPFKLNTLTNKQHTTEYYEKCYLLKRYVANNSNRFIVISENMRRYFTQALPAKLSNIFLLNNAVAVSQFINPLPKKKVQLPAIKLVTTGTLNDNKNQSFLIDVVNLLNKKGYSATLDLLGDGPNRKRLVEKAMHLNLQHAIVFRGSINSVQEYLWQSDIYVHAALTEGFGLVLVEAMAAGLPVVSLDGGGNRDIIRNGENGYILPAQDVAAFANTIIELANNKILYQQIVDEGVKTSQQFDMKNYIQKLLTLYLLAIDNK